MQRFCILLLSNLVLLSLKINAVEAVCYNGTGQSAENRLIALSIAGIVNREAPRLYLLNVYETWSYNQTDEKWKEIYQQTGAATFLEISDIQTLIDHFQEFIEGAISYDPQLTYGNFQGQNFRWQAEVAAMIGGLSNCIPLPYSNTQLNIIRPDSVMIADHFNGQAPLKISARLEHPAHPWNNVVLSQEERYFSILDWALQNLLTRTNNRCFYLREITDWAVGKRMFQMNLAGTESLNFNSLSSAKAEKIEQVMNYLRTAFPAEVFHVYGWMRPEPLVQWISAWGGIFHETLLGNLSWHHIYPALSGFDYNRPSVIDPDSVNPGDKYYVLFIGSEGDAGNWVTGFQSGAWLSPVRGQVPVAWGWNLHLLDQLPFMAQYYYNTATANDGFVSVTTPLGYAYPDMFPAETLDSAREQTSFLLQKFKIPSVYAYKHYNGAGVSTFRGIEISNNFNFHKLGNFAEQTQTALTFLFDPALSTQQYYTQFGGLLYNHVNDETFYANVTNLNTAANRIINKLKNKPRPGFLLAGYQRFRSDGTSIGSGNPADITLPRLKTLMELIASDPDLIGKVEFVTPEKFTWLMHKYIASLGIENPDAHRKNTMKAWLSTDDVLRIQASPLPSGEALIEIFDLNGKLLSARSLYIEPNTQLISHKARGLSRGVYVISISTAQQKQSCKFIR